MLKLILRSGAALVLLALVLVLSGVFHVASIGPGVAAAAPGHAKPKNVGRAERTERPVWYEAVGTLDSTTRVDVGPRISGQIMALHADVGDVVEAGQLLAELDDRDFRAKVERARSAVRAAQAGRDEAESAFQRTRRLADRDAATPEVVERSQAAAARAEAQLAAATEMLAEAEIGLGHAHITSPVAGVVRSRPAESGAIAFPGGTLFTIHDPASLRIEAAVREGVIDRVVVGRTMPVSISNREASLEAVVKEVVPSADPATRTFIVRAELADATGLYPGMFGRLFLELDPRPVVLVPRDAVKRVGQLHTVLTLHEDRWVPRYVTVGDTHDGFREVFSGLQGGETIGWGE